MNDLKDGGPAFPLATEFGDDVTGMTLRDYFAAKAMQGMLASGEECVFAFSGDTTLATRAYGIANAMLAERGK